MTDKTDKVCMPLCFKHNAVRPCPICDNDLDYKEIQLPNNYETGFNSITTDKRHIILWDFDTDSLKDIVECLIEIQKYFMLSNIFIISSRHGYNAICLDKYTKDKVFNIKSLTMLSDKKHDVIGYKRNGWVLRIGDDKKIETVLLSIQQYYPKSNAHRKLLENLFDIEICETYAFDNSTKILFEKYKRKEKSVINGEEEEKNTIRNGIPKQSKRLYRLEQS